MAIRPSTGTRNAMVDAAVDRIDLNGGAGVVRIYTGAQPATGDAAATGTLLATVALAAVAFGNSASGTASASDPAAVNAVAAGTAGWFRVLDGASNAVFDGSVTDTAGSGDMKLSSVALSAGISVDITSFTVTAPA